LRGYGQKNPVQEYKRESFSMFTLLLETINIELVRALCSLNLEKTSASVSENSSTSVIKNQEKASSLEVKSSVIQRPKIARQASKLKVGRNDPCPCGSGKKYKQCHG